MTPLDEQADVDGDVLEAVEPVQMAVAGNTISVGTNGVPLKAEGGAVLMGLGSFTHAFDQNQRYVVLGHSVASNGTVTLSATAASSVAPPGDYLLFLVSEQGVPSEGVHVKLAQQAPEPTCDVHFVVDHSGTRFGQDVRITGDAFALGEWKAPLGLEMSGKDFPPLARNGSPSSRRKRSIQSSGP